MVFQVVYLTGPPASGKSTLCARLRAKVNPLVVYHYSALLVDHLRSARPELSDLREDDLRERSADLITAADVEAVDKRLIATVQCKRTESHLIIDSHAVTKERYGYRVTPFSLPMLGALQPTLIVMLYTESGEIHRRISESSQGRPRVSSFEADLHTALQSQVAISYGLQLSVPIYFFDSTGSVDQPVEEIALRLNSAPQPESS